MGWFLGGLRYACNQLDQWVTCSFLPTSCCLPMSLASDKHNQCATPSFPSRSLLTQTSHFACRSSPPPTPTPNHSSSPTHKPSFIYVAVVLLSRIHCFSISAPWRPYIPHPDHRVATQATAIETHRMNLAYRGSRI